MSNWQRKVRPGDALRLSAAAYNEFVDASRRSRQRRVESRARGVRTSNGMTLAKNVSEVAIPSWSPQRISSYASINQSRKNPDVLLEIGGSVVNNTRTSEAFVVTQEPILPNRIGKVAASGVTVCKVSSDPLVQTGVRLTLDFGLLSPSSNGSAMCLSTPAAVVQGGVKTAIVRLGMPSGAFLAEIGANPQVVSAANSNAEWEYSWSEVVWDGTDWVDEILPRDSSVYGEARNLLEAGNQGSIAYGITVDPDDLTINDTQVAFQPVPAGTVVEMRFTTGVDSSVQPYFSAPNAVGGPCE